ncbi:hypothetical protein MUTS5_16580 [Escherichia coli]|nr:hypothetical protein MUTS5_16580 [Escherichia coli]BEA92045.1 hypothetical protein VEE29_17100 [Escherichia coli]
MTIKYNTQRHKVLIILMIRIIKSSSAYGKYLYINFLNSITQGTTSRIFVANNKNTPTTILGTTILMLHLEIIKIETIRIEA